jgi:hypothetical protein
MFCSFSFLIFFPLSYATPHMVSSPKIERQIPTTMAATILKNDFMVDTLALQPLIYQANVGSRRHRLNHHPKSPRLTV